MDATDLVPPTIRCLPTNLVNQIAAGEVIERPASVVKELVENSLDAGARRIEVTIGGGGTELIRIADDGCGMTADQLPLAVTSHATSKLPDDEALFHVGTLGFRGEALASIGSCSQLTIRSRVREQDAGHELDVRGGVITEPAPCGCPPGTVIEVKNLFFNTPVRHRFLKTAQTERGHIVEAFTRLSLANPHVHFVLHNNQKTMFDLPATTRWCDRIGAFFGDEIAGNLIPIEDASDDIRVSGYVCDPSVSRGNNRMQYLFLNGRHIRDRALGHALGEAYRGLLMVGRFPVCFLRLDMPPAMVDVNVHPTKLEVRFTDGGRVYARVLQTLRHRFLNADLTQRVGPATEVASPGGSADDATARLDSAATPANLIEPLPDIERRQRQAVIDWARTGQTDTIDRERSTRVQTMAPSITGPGRVPNFQPFPASAGGGSEPSGRCVEAVGDAAHDPQDASTVPGETSPGETSPEVSHLGFQVHQRYLVTQDEAGMVVIDQHALHERVLYERVCTKVLGEGGQLESQRLLVPEPVSLTPAERTAALDAAEMMAKIGLEIEDFGGGSIVIRAYPALLPHTPPAEMLRTFLEALLGAGKAPDAKDLVNHLLATIACKAAVKAGDRLSSAEITALLEQKDLYHDTHHCPHGRPTALFFSRDELDRMFGRLGPRGRV